MVQREKWFEKLVWSYMPCHWKGLAVLVGVILTTLAAIFLGQAVLNYWGYRSADWLPFFIFLLPALFFLSAIAKRHS